MKTVVRVALLLVVGLAAGFAYTKWNSGKSPPAESAAAEAAPAPKRESGGWSWPLASDGGDGRLAARVAQLESQVQELMKRQQAEDEAAASRRSAFERGRGEAGAPGAQPEGGFGPRGGPGGSARQLERLVAAGFTADRAAWIQQRLEALAAQSQQALRDGTAAPGTLIAPERQLRAELGDAEYERYLQALGRPTSVAVLSVQADSAAQQAGLRQGDQIVSYGGERVYDVRELTQLTSAGQAGGPVLVEVQRAGQTVQLTLPRGPIGIIGGGGRGGGFGGPGGPPR